MHLFLYLLFSMLLLLSACGAASENTSVEQKPNIIYILADDLGYGELGAYGQEVIETPNIDALALGGMRFTQHYSGAPVCAPARCVLLTGQHAGHAYVRGNDEWGERGKVWDYQAMFDDPSLEGQRPLPDSVVTIAELLQEAGYKTGMVGKWGLGAPNTAGVPNKQGFDFFFGYNCQRQAHTFFPMHLWKNEERVLLDNKFVPLHANLAGDADPNDPVSYQDFQLNDYSPDLMHREALQFIQENREQPFFLYYASPIPHLPLQAPREWVEYYQQKLGPETPYTGSSYFPNRTPRATYAAMISYLDQQVGELVAKLKKLGLYENTLIIFSSDNGPSYLGGVDAAFFNSAGDFSEEYGYTKGFVHEGGIRVPMIASWPGRVQAGTETEHLSAFYDILPTLGEVAGVEPSSYTDGISFLPTLLGKEQQVTHEYLYWEFPSYTGQQALRLGPWKGVRKNILQGNTDIALYHLASDTLEQHNLAAAHPEMVRRIKTLMDSAHHPATLDRFKMEALGDVKEAYLQARKRTRERLGEDLTWSLQEGYFLISEQTKFAGAALAPEAVAVLQKQLQQTGGYKLRTREGEAANTLRFGRNTSLQQGAFRLSCDPEQILIEAKDQRGFQNGVQTLMQLMDDKIWEHKEMHRPNWMIAAVQIEGKE